MKTILVWRPDDAATVERFKAVLGNDYFNHGGLLRVGFTELRAGEQLEVTAEPMRTKVPDGDSLMIHVPDATRGALLTALATMPDEAFGWFVLACPVKAMMHGGRAQIWPDGMGGFTAESRASVEAVRDAADAYLGNAPVK